MSNYGVSTWYTGEKPEVDIVFVHGLRGHREKTWTKDGHLWPKEYLPTDIENCRLMSFGYDSNVIHSSQAEITQGSLTSDARCLCALLKDERSTPESETRPLIFVAHSLGGLVCAEAVILGDRNVAGDSVNAIARYIKGIIFLGTPFAGSHLAKWGNFVRAIFNVVKKTDQKTLKTLVEDSNDLKHLGVAFPEVIRKRNETPEKVKVTFFYETLDTFGVRVVEESSSAYVGVGEVLPIRANHLDICKFASPEEDGYKLVKAKLLEIIHARDTRDSPEPRSNTINNYGNKVLNQAMRDINITSQTNTF
ncbi:uncharacterized protein BO80DRAFT_448750 [Aspergillus ibericus CBS 121593]|uniref:DUF676 domain-containing protein n=1 Tax=Aspergillus ibericus CBS 121593 TaxID=1448316 RepID=A0A395GP03_9EURO|nr:hypothetical protein BO80DRAFT_448750 [Aspergillus ibericus CBS 121593]RAK97066.1 hypothetical protein BO80DRAFT_448750 [Aspergillus ibericus CBS 121593]